MANEIKKVQIQMHDEITGEVIADAMPVTLANAVTYDEDKNVSDKIEEVEEQTVYSNGEPIITGVGDIKPGDTFNNVPLKEVIDRMLYPYTKPQVSISGNPGGGAVENGNSVTPTFTVTPQKKSKPIQSVKLYRGNDVIASNTNGAVLTHTVDTPVTATTTFKAVVSDGQEEASTSITYTFVNPLYYGVLNTDTPNANDIKSLTKVVTTPGNKTYKFTSDGQRITYACPPGWTVTKVIDQSSFDNTNAFINNPKTVNLGTAEQPINYTVYIGDPISCSNFELTFYN